LSQRLFEIGAVQFGTFVLKSGAESPVYVDLRLLVSDPPLLREAARSYAAVLQDLAFDRIAAIPLAALPLGTAISLEMDRPMIYPRMDAKAHGTHRTVEGTFARGEQAVVVDDVISSGLSKLEAIRPLEEAGLVVRDVVVLIDRGGTGAGELQEAGYALHAVTRLRDIVDHLAAQGSIGPDQADEVRAYILGSK
jgi:uridine monophosphate synthetase